ncbi:MAG: HD domain-containing protein [Myxococcota bacterium]
MKNQLVELLEALDGVEQDPVWHPEGDALFHSLQVYAIARAETSDPELWAAALLHDVGKGLPGPHEEEGVYLLQHVMPDRVLWLIRHHLDLMRQPNRTRRRLRGTQKLRDLEQLRRWDVKGRNPDAVVGTIDDAVQAILEVRRWQT